MCDSENHAFNRIQSHLLALTPHHATGYSTGTTARCNRNADFAACKHPNNMSRSLRLASSIFSAAQDCHFLPTIRRCCHAVSDAGKTSSPLLRQLDVDMPSSVNDLIPPLEQRPPQMNSLRTGMIGIKVGMVSEWDEYGVLTPFTVLWFDENQVCAVLL